MKEKGEKSGKWLLLGSAVLGFSILRRVFSSSFAGRRLRSVAILVFSVVVFFLSYLETSLVKVACLLLYAHTMLYCGFFLIFEKILSV